MPFDPRLSVADEIAKLAALRARGALTDEEFVAAKARVMGLPRPSTFSLSRDVAQLAAMNAGIVEELVKLASSHAEGRLSHGELERRRQVELGRAVPGPPVDPRAAPFVHGSIAGGACDSGARAHNAGRLEEAEAQYVAALAIAHPEVSPSAAFGLGNVRLEQGDVARAEDAWRAAMAFGFTDGGGCAAFNLGNLCKREGRLRAAQDANEFSIGCGHEAAYLAAENLALLHLESDRPAAARDIARHAAAQGHVGSARRIEHQIAEYEDWTSGPV